jgi:hypothetical protein
MADIMATHPYVVLGGQLQENPYYVEPEVYLQKVALRRAHPVPMRADAAGNAGALAQNTIEDCRPVLQPGPG